MSDDEFERYFAPDPLLRTFVHMAEEGTVAFGVTLVVGGVLVSGVLESTLAYLEGLATEMRERGSGGSAEGMAQGLDAVAASVAEHEEFTRLAKRATDDEEGEGQGVARQPLYVHLADARIFSPDLAAGITTPVHWRGRLTAVDAFFIGQPSVRAP